MAELTIVVPGAEISERVRDALGELDAELVPVQPGFPALKAALAAAETPVVVVLAGAQDPPELIGPLLDKLAASPEIDAVLAAHPRSSLGTRLAQAVATRAPVRGATGTCAMRRPLAERVARVGLDQADLPALLARLQARTDVLCDARTSRGAPRPSLVLSGALAQWLVLVAVVLYALGGASFMLISPGAARVVNLVMLVLCALALVGGLIVHVRMTRAVRERT